MEKLPIARRAVEIGSFCSVDDTKFPISAAGPLFGKLSMRARPKRGTRAARTEQRAVGLTP
jgi:hypothetical protein